MASKKHNSVRLIQKALITALILEDSDNTGIGGIQNYRKGNNG